MTIHNLECQQDEQTGSLDSANFIVDCASGTYVRALARDISHDLGTLGYVGVLRRLQDGEFKAHHMITLERLQEIAQYNDVLLPMEIVLDDIPAVYLDSDEIACFKKGQTQALKQSLTDTLDQSKTVKVMLDKLLQGVGRLQNSLLKPQRVLV